MVSLPGDRARAFVPLLTSQAGGLRAQAILPEGAAFDEGRWWGAAVLLSARWRGPVTHVRGATDEPALRE
jgi:hypothetical protein